METHVQPFRLKLSSASSQVGSSVMMPGHMTLVDPFTPTANTGLCFHASDRRQYKVYSGVCERVCVSPNPRGGQWP